MIIITHPQNLRTHEIVKRGLINATLVKEVADLG